MKKLTATLLAFALIAVTLAGPAFAAKKKVRAKEYTFVEMSFGVDRKGPSMSLYSAAKRARFERLLSLKRSFQNELLETSKFPVFR